MFERSGDEWIQQAKLSANDGDRDDSFGGSVAVSGDDATAIVGAGEDENPNGESAGSAYLFEQDGGEWRQRAKLAPDDGDTDDWFGYSVAMSGDGTTAVIGASGDEDPNGEGAGSAYVYARPSKTEVAASFSASPDAPTVNEPITFDAQESSPSDEIEAYRWSFPNLETRLRGPVVEHAFGTPGEHSVTLQVEAGGETATTTRSITVTPPDHGTVAGELVGSDGTPVAGAPVQLVEPIHEWAVLRLLQGERSDPLPTVRATTTDANGQFRIEDVPTGEYLLAVEPTGSFGGALREDVVVRPGETTDLTVEVQAGRYLAELDGVLSQFRAAAKDTIDDSTRATADTYLGGYETFEASEVDDKEVLLRILQTINFALGLTDPDSAITVQQEVLSYLGNTVGVPVADHGFDHLMAERWQTVAGTRFQGALENHTDTCLAMDPITAFEPTGSVSEAQSAFEETETYQESTSAVDSAWTRYDEGVATTEPPDEFDIAGVKAVLRKQTNWLETDSSGLAAGIIITPSADIYLPDVAEYHADLFDAIEGSYEAARSGEVVAEGLQAAGKGLAISGVASGGTTAVAGSVAYAGGVVGSFGLKMYQTFAKTRLAHTWANTLTYWVSDLTAVSEVSSGLVDWLAGELEDPTDLQAIDGSIESADLGLISAYDRTVLIANQPQYPDWWILPKLKWKAIGTANVTIRNTGDVEAAARAIAIDTYQVNKTDSINAVSDAASFKPPRGDQPFTLEPGAERTVEFEFDADFDPFNLFQWHQMEIGLWMEGRVPDRNTQFYYVLPDIDLIPFPSTAASGLARLADRPLATDRFVVTHDGKRTDEGLTVSEWAQRVGPITQLVDTQVTPDSPQAVAGYTPSDEAVGVTFVMGATAGSDVALHVYDDQNRRVGPQPGGDDVVEIPSASYSGSTGARQIVEIEDASADRYRVRVDATRLTDDRPVPVSVHAIEIPEREATLVVSPTVARQILSMEESGSVRLDIGEGGNQTPISGVDVRVGSITTAGGSAIPSDAIDVSPATFDLSAGEQRTVRVAIGAGATSVPETGETRYEGPITVETENAGTATVDLSVLMLDAGVTGVDLTSAASSVRGIHLHETELGEQAEPPAGFTVESAYEIRSVGEGEFTVAFSEERIGENQSAYTLVNGEWTPVDLSRYPESSRAVFTAGNDVTLVVGRADGDSQTGDQEDESGGRTTAPGQPGDVESADGSQILSTDRIPDWAPLVGGGAGIGTGAGLYYYLKNRGETDGDE